MVPPWLPLLAFRLASAASEDALVEDVLPGPSFDFSGEITLGWRFVDVDGSRAQYDEDLNLESGPVLRAFRLEGRRSRGSSASDSCLLSLYGLGDPQTSGLAQVSGSALRATARYDRSVFEGNGTDDFHPFDFERERASLRVESAPSGPDEPHGGIEITAGRRDGLSIGTRAVRFDFIGGGSVRQEDRTLGARGDVGFETLGWDLDLEGGVEGLQSQDRREFSAPSPSDPTFTQTESFHADADATSREGRLRARRAFDAGRIDADFGVEYSEIDGNGRMHDDETALFSIGDPYRLTTDADSEVEESWFQVDAGLRRQVSPDLAWRARIEHVEEKSSGNLITDTLLEEPPGSPPSPLTQQKSLSFSSRVELLELGLETAISAATDLDLTVEGGIDHETVRDVTDGVPTSAFDEDLDRLGARATLATEASRETLVTLEAGYELAPTHDASGQTFLHLEDEQGAFAGARVRWRPDPRVSFTGSVKHRQREIEAFGSRYVSDSLCLSGTFAPSERWSGDVAYSLRLYDLDADAFVVLLNPVPTQTPTRVSFEGVQNVLSGTVGFEVVPAFRPRIGASGAMTNGDAEFLYGALVLDLPWSPERNLTLGVEVDWNRFDSQGSASVDDYDSAAALVYMRAGF